MISSIGFTAGKLVSRNSLQNSSNIAFKSDIDIRTVSLFDVERFGEKRAIEISNERRVQLEKERQNNENMQERIVNCASKVRDHYMKFGEDGVLISDLSPLLSAASFLEMRNLRSDMKELIAAVKELKGPHTIGSD